MPKYSIEKNPNLKVEKKEMSCDGKIANISPPLSSVSHMYVFCGAPGSGKTNAMLNLISKSKPKNGFKTSYFKAFEHVFIVSPSLHTIKNSPFKDHPEEKIYDEFNHEFLNDIDEFTTMTAADCQSTLIILDDIGSQLKNGGALERKFAQICQTRRHRFLSIWILQQRYLQLPKAIRASSLTHIFLFKPQNQLELKQIFDEMLSGAIDKKQLLDFQKFVYDKKHNFLFVDMSLANSNKFLFYKNYDLINFD